MLLSHTKTYLKKAPQKLDFIMEKNFLKKLYTRL